MSYPVGRSAIAGRLLAGLCALVVVVTLAWTLQGPQAGWRHALGWALALACIGVAWRAWLRSPRGTLRWDGAAWQWGGAAAGAPGRIERVLDLQSTMLLHWRGEGVPALWLWVERASDASHWDALRRAVYSRASTHVPPAGHQPPAAEQ